MGFISNLDVRECEQLSTLRNMADLDEAIEAARQAVDATPQDHPDRFKYLNNFGLLLRDRFSRTGTMVDLKEAIERVRLTVNVTPQDHPDRATSLNNLGFLLGDSFRRTGSMADLTAFYHCFARFLAQDTAPISCDEAGCDPSQRVSRIEDEDEQAYILVHRSTVASGELVIKDAILRDILACEYRLLCFETEAAGTLADFPCLVIREISDYCDSYKNDVWHGYAAATAAAYAWQLFFHMPLDEVKRLVAATM